MRTSFMLIGITLLTSAAGVWGDCISTGTPAQCAAFCVACCKANPNDVECENGRITPCYVDCCCSKLEKGVRSLRSGNISSLPER
ncbi:hypothetical protein FB451DRAFT_1361768 [Mycena latifolia]|nr:hypothetical protein FB451DRAFT_1361768 [Mycena latifolia]